MDPKSRIVELAAIISASTQKVEDFRQASKQEPASFDVNAPPMVAIPPTQPAVAEARDKVVAASRELIQLMQGPIDTILDAGFKDAFVFQAIYRWKIAEMVPTNGEASFYEIAQKCNQRESTIQRILRFAMTNGFFRETSAGNVVHTSASRLIIEDLSFRSAMGITCEEAFPASAKAVEALQRYPASEEPMHSGWGLMNEATKPFFEELAARFPDRHRTVSGAMDTWNSWIPAGPLIENYPWSSLGEAIVVDVGGGHGGVSSALTVHYPGLSFIVQDLPLVIENRSQHVPNELQGRIQFMPHNFFDAQPVQDADVFLFRSVFHDWPDKYCVKILKALVPALKPGTRIIINDNIMPPAGTLGPTANRAKREWDITMWLLFNARDRKEGDWARLFEAADARFKFLGVRMPTTGAEGIPPQALLAIIEAVWEE